MLKKNIISVFFLILFVIIAYGSFKEDEPPKTLEEANPDITKVVEVDGIVRVELYFAAVWDEEHWVSTIARDFDDILEDISKYWPNKYNEVIFISYAPTRDKYGNTSKSRALIATYSMSEVKKINWENFTPWDLLNLGDFEFRPIGKNAAISYCQDDSNRKYANIFCRKVLALF